MLTHTQFSRPSREGRPVAYMCGHSLGLQPLSAQYHLGQAMEAWGSLAVEGHFEGPDPFWSYHESLAGPMGWLVGARPEEVSIQNTLSVNIHLMLASFYRPEGHRRKVLMEAPAFPSDQYAVETHLRLRGANPETDILELPHHPDTYLLDEDALEHLIRSRAGELALVFLGGVQYISGQVLDMARLARVCQEAGVMLGLDLAHAVGNVPMELHAWGVDFAVWCTYKYLNGGPGALGGIYVHERHLADAGLERLAGWWGYRKETRFKMEKGFAPMPTADGWALSNPPILSMAPLKASLPMFEQVGWPTLQARSRAQTGHLRQVVAATLPEVAILTPEAAGAAGNMVTLRPPAGQARAMFEGLTGAGILCDYREPGIIRLACCPLYTTDEELEMLSDALTLVADRVVAL